MSDNNNGQVLAHIGQLHDTMKEAIGKIDNQGQRLTGIEVKVDLYRESQHELNRKVEAVDKTASETSSSVKSAHKRLDTIEKKESEKEAEVKRLRFQVIATALTVMGSLVVYFVTQF